MTFDSLDLYSSADTFFIYFFLSSVQSNISALEFKIIKQVIIGNHYWIQNEQLSSSTKFYYFYASTSPVINPEF